MRAIRGAAAGGTMRGPRGGVYHMVNGKRVSGPAPTQKEAVPSLRAVRAGGVKGTSPELTWTEQHTLAPVDRKRAEKLGRAVKKYDVGSKEHHRALADFHNFLILKVPDDLGDKHSEAYWEHLAHFKRAGGKLSAGEERAWNYHHTGKLSPMPADSGLHAIIRASRNRKKGA